MIGYAALVQTCALLFLPNMVRAFGIARWGASSQHTSTALSMADLNPGDTIVVVGGSGGLGQLVSSKMAADYKIRVTSRDPQQAQETIDNDAIECVALDLVRGSDAQLKAAIDGAAAMVISVGTTAFPTQKWKGGNTPKAIDEVAVTRLGQAAASLPTLKKVVLVTSIGVYRTSEMPFPILNLFGVLDAKKAGEDAVREALADTDADLAIVRPGRLVGGPFTNVDLVQLLQIEGGAENGVDVAAGDTLLGDCKRDACAESIVQCLTNPAASNMEFCIVSNEEKALTTEQWSSAFASLSS